MGDLSGMSAVIEESVTINASIEKVWGNTVLTVISSAEKEPITAGKSFTCLMRPLAFAVYLKPLATEVLPYRKVVLSGNKFGIRARHEFLFDGNEEKATITSRETFAGISQALPGWMIVQRKIRKLTRFMLDDLKNAAEKSTLRQRPIPLHRK